MVIYNLKCIIFLRWLVIDHSGPSPQPPTLLHLHYIPFPLFIPSMLRSYSVSCTPISVSDELVVFTCWVPVSQNMFYLAYHTCPNHHSAFQYSHYISSSYYTHIRSWCFVVSCTPAFSLILLSPKI